MVGCFVDRLLTLFKVNCCFPSKRADSHYFIMYHCTFTVMLIYIVIVFPSKN